MTNPDRLNELSDLIDRAYELALKLDENMAAYILSIASLEVSEREAVSEPAREPLRLVRN